MKLSPNLIQALNAQMNAEYGNFLFYEQLHIYLDVVAWDGFAEFMAKSSEDEKSHAGKFRDYLIERNATPTLTGSYPLAIGVPADRDAIPLAFFRAALTAEQANTNRILNLCALAEEEADYDLETWLSSWALPEQRQSERELYDLINRLQSAQGENAAILEIEERLKKN
jgi:ferritin